MARLGSEVNPEDFCVSLSQRIVDALAVGAGYPEETSSTNPSSEASNTASLPELVRPRRDAPARCCGNRARTGRLFPLGGVTTPDQSNDQVDDDNDVDH